MADDFDAGICSGSWWSAARTNSTTASFDASGMASSVTDTLMPPISGFSLSPTLPMDWNQSLLRSNNERDETSFHHLLQETPNYFRQDSSSSNLVTADEVDHQQQFLLGQQSIYEPTSCMMMDNNSYQANDSLANFTKLLGTSPPKHQSGTSTSNQLQFSNNAPFWNPSAVQFVAQSFEQKPNCSSTTTKPNTYSATKKTSSSSEASLKKPRLETPSPLPTFKVRKEKLGDRITALQQLVSPFGKTDTASVLHEAIEYIKFLHEQVNVLSTPYLKNGHPMQHQQDAGEVTKHDLRSWGLCLVPTESIYPVASETITDFWTPTFGGTYR